MSSVNMIVFTVGLAVQILTATAATDCENGAVRLEHFQDDTTPYKGYVQYCMEGQWRDLCSSIFSRVEANVVCRQLGYSDQGATKSSTRDSNEYSGNNFFNFMSGSCAGRESALTECTGITQSYSCSSNRGWVQCTLPDCTNGSLRLVNGTSYREGRVEVCVDGRWGTVCYNEELAGTVCQQLGFGSQGAMANKIDTPLPKVSCTTATDNMRLNCGDLIEGENITTISALTVECQGLTATTSIVPTCSPTVINNNNNQPNDLCPSPAASNTVIGILALLEIVTLVVCITGYIILCINIKKTQQQEQKQEHQQRVVTTVNECYSTVQSHPPPLDQPHPPPLGQPHPPPLAHTDTEEQYEIMLTSEGGIVEYDVIGQHKETSEHTQPVQ